MTTTKATNRPGVGVAILVQHQRAGVEWKYLLLKRMGSHGAGTWAPPGGHIEFDHHPEKTCSLELAEETGLHYEPERFVHIAATNDVFYEENKHYITLWYLLRYIPTYADPQIMEPNKCSDMQWFTWKQMGQLELFVPLRNLWMDNVNALYISKYFEDEER